MTNQPTDQSLFVSSIVSLVSQVPLFKVMDADDRSMLAGCMDPTQFLAEEDIITQGEKGDCMFVMAMGAAHVIKTFAP
jgi:hypothetical protein